MSIVRGQSNETTKQIKRYDESGIPGLANGQQYTTYEWETNRGYQDE